MAGDSIQCPNWKGKLLNASKKYIKWQMPISSGIRKTDARSDLSADCKNVKRSWKLEMDKQNAT